VSTLNLGELQTTISVDDREFEAGLDESEGKFRQFGKRLGIGAAAVGAAVAIALSAAFVSALDMDKAQAKLTAQLGSASFAKDLGRDAGELYAQGWGDSVADNMEAVRVIMSRGLLDEDATDAQIQGLTAKAQALAATFDVDVKEAARAAGQMVRTGLAKDADEAFDIIARGFQQTGDPADDLLDTFSEYSTQFRKLGIDGTTAMGLLQQGLKGGARDLDIVADAFKEFSLRSISGAKDVTDAYRTLGLNATKMQRDIAKGGPSAAAATALVLERLKAMKDPALQAATATALFGTQAEDLGAALYSLDFNTAAAGMGDVAGASQKMADALGNSAGAQLDAFKRKVELAFTKELASAVPTLIKVGEWLNKHSEIIVPLVGALTAVAAIYGVVTAATWLWTAAQTALAVAMAASGVTLIIIAIVAIVAGILLLWHHSDAFRNFFISMWGYIWGAIKGVWNWTKENWPLLLAILTGPFGLAVLFVVRHWQQIKDATGAAKDWVVGKFDELVDFLTGIPGRVTKSARNMWDGLVSTTRGALNMIIGLWNRLDFGIRIRVPDGIPGIGGRTFTVPDLIPDLPYLAAGGVATTAGWANVGEHGRAEQVFLPQGAGVRPLRGSDGASADWPFGPDVVLGRVVIDGTGMLQGIRTEVQLKGGGNVQAAFGQNTT